MRHSFAEALSGCGDQQLLLFRRAIVGRDEEAWACLYRYYSPLVLSWIMQCKLRSVILAEVGGVDSLVNAVFAAFALPLRPDELDVPLSFPVVLRRLKQCVNNTVAREVRQYQLHRGEEVGQLPRSPAPGLADPADVLVAHSTSEDLMQLILAELKGQDERVLVALGFMQGMKPRAIANLYPCLFPNGAKDVSRVRRNVISRLRRSHRLLHYLSIHRCIVGIQDQADGAAQRHAPEDSAEMERRHTAVRSPRQRALSDFGACESECGLPLEHLEAVKATCIARVREYLEMFGERYTLTLAVLPGGRGAPSAVEFYLTVNGRAFIVMYNPSEAEPMALRECQHDHGRDVVMEQIIQALLQQVGLEQRALWHLVVQEVPARRGADYLFAFDAEINDGEHALVGWYEDEFGPYYALVEE